MVAPVVPPQGPVPTVPPAPAAPGRPVVLPDGWTVTVADKIVSTVDSVRSKTTKPITLVARGVVYGLLVAVAGAFALVLLVVGFLRALYIGVGEIPGIDRQQGRSVWIVDLVLGLALLWFGSRLMAKGRIPKADTEAS
jgi:hypothetical protein